MNKTTIELTGLSKEEQGKFDASLLFKLFKLEKSNSLDQVVTGLMTVNGEGNSIAAELRGKYAPNLSINYCAGDILTYHAPASVLYALAKDPSVSYMESAKKLQFTTE